MDPQIEELKELVRQNTALTQETNAMVKSMRNAARWGRVMRFTWMGLIIATTIASYIYFMPYLAQLEALYGSIQEALQQAKDLGSQFQNGGEQQ